MGQICYLLQEKICHQLDKDSVSVVSLPENNYEKLNLKEYMDEQRIKGQNNLTYFMVSILFNQLMARVWCLKFKWVFSKMNQKRHLVKNSEHILKC